MKTSEVLRRVRKHLYEGDREGPSHQHYCCYALHFLYMVGVIGDRDRTRVRKLLMGHLEDKRSLEDWLEDKHHIQYEYTPAYRRKIMVTRKAWLTHLIEHYEAKGD